MNDRPGGSNRLNGLKKRVALSLNAFLQHWTTQTIRNQPLIHETAYIMPLAKVSPGVSVGRYSYVRGGRPESTRAASALFARSGRTC
ncbi:hypothetical protein [Cohnella rhizosphaerae]|uniref:Uncharacterized protein n=1 Tax=Cohnella rhizosphaerae TaxID=1457232 RepID=A0A9X4L0S0_9BACL|nr:hypothetical protein [Cohnella rhizosphaerae]MDG0814430.1 hypothetical protein [Cohnella rhizosphaerae]